MRAYRLQRPVLRDDHSWFLRGLCAIKPSGKLCEGVANILKAIFQQDCVLLDLRQSKPRRLHVRRNFLFRKNEVLHPIHELLGLQNRAEELGDEVQSRDEGRVEHNDRLVLCAVLSSADQALISKEEENILVVSVPPEDPVQSRANVLFEFAHDCAICHDFLGRKRRVDLDPPRARLIASQRDCFAHDNLEPLAMKCILVMEDA